MKKLYVLVSFLATTFFASAQSRFGVAEFNKKEVPAVIGEIPFEEDITKEGIIKHFEKLGYKGKKVKDFIMYSSVTLPELGAEAHDLYIMVDRKSRQEKNTSVVTMLISKGFEQFVDDTTDPNLIAATRLYVMNLREVVGEHDLELQIEKQEEVAKKAEKKFINLQEDGVDLLKDKKKIEEKIAQNNIDQATQKNEKEKQKQILENLKSKRKQPK